MSLRRGKRPKQGTSKIVNLHKQRSITDAAAARIFDAVTLMQTDEDVRALADAKRSQDEAALGRLLPILRERYGAAQTGRIFKAL